MLGGRMAYNLIDNYRLNEKIDLTPIFYDTNFLFGGNYCSPTANLLLQFPQNRELDKGALCVNLKTARRDSLH